MKHTNETNLFFFPSPPSTILSGQQQRELAITRLNEPNKLRYVRSSTQLRTMKLVARTDIVRVQTIRLSTV